MSIPNEKSRVKLSTVFGLLESNLEELGVEDYRVGQLTLEKMYIDFNVKTKKYGRTSKQRI